MAALCDGATADGTGTAPGLPLWLCRRGGAPRLTTSRSFLPGQQLCGHLDRVPGTPLNIWNQLGTADRTGIAGDR